MPHAEEAFAGIAARLLHDPEIDEGTGFGTNPGVRVGGKIFAMLVRGELVVKLPADRCGALVEEGSGSVFQVGKRPMREWVSIAPDGAEDWDALADEALSFVRAAGARRR